MPQVTLRVLTNASIVRQGFEHLSNALPNIGRKRLRQAATDVKDLMKVPGEPPVYPLEWDSDQQRADFMASNGFGGGIPYTRTDRYIEGWEVVKSSLRGYTVINRVPYAKAVGGLLDGSGQSKMHAFRWPRFRDAVDTVAAALPEAVASHLRKFIARGLEGWTGEDSETEMPL